MSLNLVTDKEKVTKLNDTLNDIIEFCSTPRSMTEIMEYIGLKHRYNVKHRYIDPFIDSGFLVMTIPEKPNSKSQKYKRSLAWSLKSDKDNQPKDLAYNLGDEGVLIRVFVDFTFYAD